MGDVQKYFAADVETSGVITLRVCDAASCGDVTVTGSCVDGSATYCGADDTLVSERCAGSCGWDFDANGYRCLAGPDPCGGLSPRGQCDGNAARWCQRGVQKRRDCTACGQTCVMNPSVGATCE